MRRAAFLGVLALAACTKTTKTDPHPAAAASSSSTKAAAPCETHPLRTELVPGITVERFLAPVAPTVPVGDRCVTVVRVDPARHTLQLHTARTEGGARTVDRWSENAKLEAVLNAAMYADDQRSVGLMVSTAAVNNGADNKKYGGFLAWDRTRDGIPEVAAFGRDCAGFDLDAIRRDYRSVVQNYRLLDCQGHPIAWQDPKLFSAAVVGTDKRGWLVFAHVRTPYAMTDLAKILASPDLEMASAMHVEGGPEASLFVNAGGATVREMGSYETGFMSNDDNHDFWPIPNVLGVVARP
ncbi:MAG TPA: phosphodiester glycosidase family protein [Polyangiaceae bacterium]